MHATVLAVQPYTTIVSLMSSDVLPMAVVIHTLSDRGGSKTINFVPKAHSVVRHSYASDWCAVPLAAATMKRPMQVLQPSLVSDAADNPEHWTAVQPSSSSSCYQSSHSINAIDPGSTTLAQQTTNVLRRKQHSPILTAVKQLQQPTLSTARPYNLTRAVLIPSPHKCDCEQSVVLKRQPCAKGTFYRATQLCRPLIASVRRH
jgi:hypothetical protein